MRVRPGLALLWRGAGQCQVGIDPRCGVVLEGLTPAEQRLLDHLAACPGGADRVALGRPLGVPEHRVHELLDLLRRSGVLTEPGPDAGPDEAYWARLRDDGDGTGVLARRAAATVAVAGLDRLGMRLAGTLAAAGVGTLLLEDPAPVTEADVGAYHPRDVGRERAACAADTLRSTRPSLRTSARPGTHPDLLVAVSYAVADPVRLRPLMREDVVHLPVVLGDVAVSVGPLVVPGAGPCVRCLDLHRTDADPAWPAVATQLRVTRSPGTDVALAHLGADLAAHQVLAALDGRSVAIRSATLEVDALDPVPKVRGWSVHPECGCTDLAG